MTYELNRPLTDREREIVEELRSRANVANAIARARIKLGLSQHEVGARAGTKQSRISELEGLQGNVRFDTLDRVAQVLGLMIDLVPRTSAEARVNIDASAAPFTGLKVDRDTDGSVRTVRLPDLWANGARSEVGVYAGAL